MEIKSFTGKELAKQEKKCLAISISVTQLQWVLNSRWTYDGI